jgi:cobalt-zinc-cadmium efflux system protein
MERVERHHQPHHHHHHGGGGLSLRISVGLTLCYALVEAMGGLWSGSLTLLGDAGHMFTDAVALGLAATAAWLATRPPSARHSWGLGRAEVVAALANALFMVALVGMIAVEAIARLRTPGAVNGGAVTLIAAVGLVINGAVAWVLSRSESTLNVRAALLHVIGDLLGSVAALVAGAVIWLTGWTPIDPILALGVCLLILSSTLRLLIESLQVVMEGVPAHLDLPEVGRAMAGVEGVRSVHDLHIWTVASGQVALSAHVVIHDLRGWRPVLESLNHLLHDRFRIEHTTLQPESDVSVIHFHRRRDDPV